MFGHTPARRYGTLPVINYQYEWTVHVPPQAWIAGYTHVVTFAQAVGHLDGGPWRWQALPGQWASTLQLSVSPRNGLIPDMLHRKHGFGSGWVGFETQPFWLEPKWPRYGPIPYLFPVVCLLRHLTFSSETSV